MSSTIENVLLIKDHDLAELFYTIELWPHAVRFPNPMNVAFG